MRKQVHKPLGQILSLMLLLSAGRCFALGRARPSNDGILYESSSGLFGKKTTLQGPSTSSILLDQNSGGTLFVTGPAASELSAGLTGRRNNHPTPPPAPRLVPLSIPGLSAIAPLTEIGQNIFIVSRHALLGIPMRSLQEALEKSGIDLSRVHFYEFLDTGGEPLDAILVSDGGASFGSSAIAPEIRIGEDYFSYQLGTVGGQAVQQQSFGQIEQVGSNRFYLPLDKTDFTTARSSGSVVYVSSNGVDWSLGGVIECYIPSRTTANGLAIPGGIRSIPFSELKDATLHEVTADSLIHSPRASTVELDGRCIPIDGRGGGGD